MPQIGLTREHKRSRPALLVLRYYDLLICTAVSAAYAIVILRYQVRWPDIATRWDSLHYVEVAHDMMRGEQPSAAAPFVYRLGLPFLAAFIFPSDIARGMSRIALVSAVMTPTLMMIWLKMFSLKRTVRFALVAVFASSLFGPVRFGLFYPTLTYPMFWVFLLTGLILIRRVLLGGRGKYNAFALIGVIVLGTFVRETMVIVPLTLVIAGGVSRQSINKSRPVVMGALGLIVGVLVIAVIHVSVMPTGSYAFTDAAMYWLANKSILQVGSAVFLTFGPMLAVIGALPSVAIRFWRDNPELPILTVICLCLAVIGGTNTEVFLYWAAPCILATVGHVMSVGMASRFKALVAVLLLCFQMIAQRSHISFPTLTESARLPEVFLSPLGGASYLQLWSQFAQTEILQRVFVTNLLLCAIFAVIFSLPTLHLRDLVSKADRSDNASGLVCE